WVAVAMHTEGETIAIAQASGNNPGALASILPQLCEGEVDPASRTSTVSTNEPSSIASRTFMAGAMPIDVTGGGFNGDGYLDVAVANLASNDLTLLLNDGGTGFLPPIPVSAGSGPRAIASGDFDNDGILDL